MAEPLMKAGTWARDVANALGTYIPGFAKPPARFITEDGKAVHGVVAEFETPADLYHAAEKVRDAGYTRWDVYTPFPIHGMEQAMGIKRTSLPLMVACCGFMGSALALLFQYWVTKDAFPLVVQGKPFGAWEPFVPILFELGVLPAAISSLTGMMLLNGLPRWHHPLLSRPQFWSVSNDRFFLCIEAEDRQFEAAGIRDLLESVHGKNIELVEDDG